MGGATSSTSKVVILSKSKRKDCDVDYLFGQVAIDQPLVDWSGNCGNLSAAVGPCAIGMLARAKASLSAEGRIVDWHYEVFSNTHSTRPSAPGSDNNLLASWYLGEPSKPGPATNIPQPAGGSDRNAVPLYDFPNWRIVNHLISPMPVRVSALRTLGAYANVFALESFMRTAGLQARS